MTDEIKEFMIEEDHQMIQIHPYEKYPRVHVSIYKPEKYINSDGFSKSVINWSSIGAIKPEEAEIFAHAILHAMSIARKLNE